MKSIDRVLDIELLPKAVCVFVGARKTIKSHDTKDNYSSC